MKRIYLPVGVVAALIAVAGMGIGAASGGTHKRAGHTLTFFEEEAALGFQFVDTPPVSPNPDPASPDFAASIGDQFTLASKVFDHKGSKRKGSLLEQGTTELGGSLEDAEAAFLFQATLRLKHGDIAALGVVHHGTSTLALVGGTGAYEGAHGTLTEDEGPHRVKVTVHLLGG
jgi:hypothetical protein